MIITEKYDERFDFVIKCDLISFYLLITDVQFPCRLYEIY